MGGDWVDESRRRLSGAIGEFGAPIYGLSDRSGTISMISGSPCAEVAVAYQVSMAEERIEVTTGKQPLGGTEWMLNRLVANTIGRKPKLPWSIQVEEAHHMVAVETRRTQFRVFSASTGHWLAAGGYGKRHLLISGTPGTEIENCELVPSTFAFDEYPPTAHPETRS